MFEHPRLAVIVGHFRATPLYCRETSMVQTMKKEFARLPDPSGNGDSVRAIESSRESDPRSFHTRMSINL